MYMWLRARWAKSMKPRSSFDGDANALQSALSYDFMRSAEMICSFPVSVITVDSFVRENAIEGVDLVKIDTESTEPQVLLGMIETIRRDQPAIICEVLKGRASEKLLAQILRPLGYRFYLLTPDGRWSVIELKAILNGSIIFSQHSTPMTLQSCSVAI